MDRSAKTVKIKMLGAFIFFSLVPMLCIAIYSYSNIKNEITTSTLAHLEAIAKIKSLQIERFHERSLNYIRTIQDSLYLRKLFLTEGKQSQNFNDARKAFELNLKQYTKNNNIDEIHIIGLDGKIFASSSTGDETLIVTNNKIAFEKGKSQVYFSDIYIGHEKNKNYLFTISAPITAKDKLVGVVVAELVADDFFNQIQDYSGLGATGETLLAKSLSDKVLFLNPLRHDVNAAMSRSVDIAGDLAIPAINGVSGKIGSGLSTDYRGISVLAAWRYIPTTKWGIVAKIDTDEALKPLQTISESIIFTGLILLIFGVIASIKLTLTIAEPVEYLELSANTDTLTGLPNRELLMELLTQALNKARLKNSMVAVMFLDLDGFKNVNDTYGHEMGDALLKKAALRIDSCTRQNDTVARLGGDEFVVVLCGIKEFENISKIASNIVDSLCSEFSINATIIKIGVSIGISVFPKHGATAEDMLRLADEAMYEVKKSGKNSFKYFEQQS